MEIVKCKKCGKCMEYFTRDYAESFEEMYECSCGNLVHYDATNENNKLVEGDNVEYKKNNYIIVKIKRVISEISNNAYRIFDVLNSFLVKEKL